ncbi:MAG: hypothetical protein MIK82_22280, partial [Pantoea piersonii]|uniref:hypothetical protein n=1 Tax=Pantoea piersonii TaxID=2364647 RepID=UPI001C533198
ADRNRSHWSTSKTPSYTKSVSWQHHPDVRPLRYHLHSEILGTVFPDADLDEVTAGIAIPFHCLR